jgi:hypothetical protein
MARTASQPRKTRKASVKSQLRPLLQLQFAQLQLAQPQPQPEVLVSWDSFMVCRSKN